MGSFIVLNSSFLTPLFTLIFIFFLSSFLFVSVWDSLGVLGYWLLLSPLVLGFYLLCCEICEILVLQYRVRPDPLRWETQVQLWTTRELVIMWNINWQELSERPPSQQYDQAPPNVQKVLVLESSCQTFSKTETQPCLLAKNATLLKII